AIYFRSADGQTDRLVTLAGGIVGRRVAVIVTTGGGGAAPAGHPAATTGSNVVVSGAGPGASRLALWPNRARPHPARGDNLSAGAGGKATGAPPRAGPGYRLDRGLAQPNQCEFSNATEGCSGCRALPRAASEHPECE